MATTSNIVHNRQGRFVGKIEDRIFIKEVYGNKHMLRQPMAWCIDVDILKHVIEPNCLSIHIVDRDTNRKYVCGVKTFVANCHKINRFSEEQYYLELVYWRVV